MEQESAAFSFSRRKMLAKLGAGAAIGLAASASNLAGPGIHGETASAATLPPDTIAKALVQAVATANVSSLMGLPTVDGYAFATGERALLTSQDVGTENGIWNVNSGGWTRPADFASGAALSGACVSAQKGAVYGKSQWLCTTSGIKVDTSATAWTNAAVSESFVGVQRGAPSGGFTLSPRTIVTNFGVPTFRSVAVNAVTAIDLVPNGTPAIHASDPGFAWIDVCDADCLTTRPGLTALRVGAHLKEVFVGAVSYSSSPKPLHLKVPSDNNGTLVSMAKFQQATRGVATADGYVILGGNDPWCILNALGGSVVAASGYELGNATSAGFLYIPQMAGPPTAKPTGFGKSVPLVYDVVGHQLWAFEGGSWRSSGAFA